MIAITLTFGFTLDEGLLAIIASFLLLAVLVLWVRAYVRSRKGGWLLMAASLVVGAAGNLVAVSYLWTAIGAFLLFAGSLVLCRDLRKTEGDKT